MVVTVLGYSGPFLKRCFAYRSQNLLEVVHDLFEEQTSIDKVIMKIMQRAQRLLKCERAAVLLVDESCDSTRFSKLFDLNSPKNMTSNVKK